MRRFEVLLFTIVLAMPSLASAAEVTPDYLAGEWCYFTHLGTAG